MIRQTLASPCLQRLVTANPKDARDPFIHVPLTFCNDKVLKVLVECAQNADLRGLNYLKILSLT